MDWERRLPTVAEEALDVLCEAVVDDGDDGLLKTRRSVEAGQTRA